MYINVPLKKMNDTKYKQLKNFFFLSKKKKVFSYITILLDLCLTVLEYSLQIGEALAEQPESQ